jgi:tetratricopeptide (TPR) repeat protein
MKRLKSAWGLLVVAALAGGISPAWGIDPSRAPSGNAAEPEVLDAKGLLRRLERVEAELLRLKQPAALPNPRPAALPFVDDLRLLSTNVWDVAGVRYLSLRLSLLNQGNQPRVLDPSKVSLVVDGKPLTLKSIPEDFKKSVVDVGGRLMEPGEVMPTGEVSLPPHEVVSVSLVFAPIGAVGPSPALALRYEMDGAPVELDLNRFARGLLELQTVRIGPGDVCTLATIGGALNTINAADLADALVKAANQGSKRVVISWGTDAAAPISDLVGWLGAAGVPEAPRFASFPALPSDLLELRFVSVPTSVPVEPIDGSIAVSHHDLEDAVAAALATVFPRQPRQVVMDQLKKGHPAVRAAALRYGAESLSAGDIGFVKSFVDDPSATVQAAACIALAAIDAPQSVAVLRELAEGARPVIAEAAFEAMASSRFAAALGVAGELAATIRSIPEATLLKILLRRPQAAFRPRILQLANSKNPELREAALPALLSFPIDEALPIYEEALASKEKTTRTAALSAIVVRLDEGDGRIRELAVQQALARLEADPGDPLGRGVAEQTRDGRFVALLIPRVSDAKRDRTDLIELLGGIGDDRVMREFIRSYDGFKGGERAAALKHLSMHHLPEAVTFAMADLKMKSADVTERAVAILVQDASDEAVHALALALRDRKDHEVMQFSEALSTIGTPAAKDELYALRLLERADLRLPINWAFRQIWDRSPGSEFVTQGQQVLEMQPPNYDQALDLFNTATQFDPLLPGAYTGRGNLRLRQERWEDAVREFSAALELNPDDSMPLTGLTLARVMQGRVDEAFEWITQAAPFYESDPNFLYNAACVYSRGSEQIAKKPGSDAAATAAREQAIGFLGQSVEKNFQQGDLMTRDHDLDAIRSDPRFEAIVKKATEGN